MGIGPVPDLHAWTKANMQVFDGINIKWYAPFGLRT